MKYTPLLLGLLLTGCSISIESRAGDPLPASENAVITFEEIDVEGSLMFLTGFQFLPNANEFLAILQDGTVKHFRLEGNRADKIGEFKLPVHHKHDCGLLSLAFDPDFASNHYVYVAHCVSPQLSAVTRITFDAANYRSIPTTATEIISFGTTEAIHSLHSVGSIGFEPDGTLFVFTGEKDVSKLVQGAQHNLGALLRIVPSRDPNKGGYTPAADNPFIGDPAKSPAIYAYGFRMPWRGILASNGTYVVADVGANRLEELNLVTAPGQNFGWPIYEGRCNTYCEGFAQPAILWAHSLKEVFRKEDPLGAFTEHRVGWVGPEYKDPSIDRYDGKLTDKILFGDFCAGWIRTLALKDDNTFRDEHVGHLEMPVDWTIGPDGYIYTGTYPLSITEHGVCPRLPPDTDEDHIPTHDHIIHTVKGYDTEGGSSIWRMVLKNG